MSRIYTPSVYILNASQCHTLQVISQGSTDMLPNLRGGAWDPHNHNLVAAISDSSLQLWDLRSMELILYLDLLFTMLLSIVQFIEMLQLYLSLNVSFPENQLQLNMHIYGMWIITPRSKTLL